RMLSDVSAMFAVAFDSKKRCWPYQLKMNQDAPNATESHGTSAMILAAIGKMRGICTLRDGSLSEVLEDLDQRIPDILHLSVELANNIEKAGQVQSGTFGSNNPPTISHLAELTRGLRDRPEAKRIKDVLHKSKARERTSILISKNPADQ